MRPVLLHLIPAADWPAALRHGAVVPPSLAEVGFVHLSTPDQVHLPANRLFAGRTDVVLLVVDPAALTDEVRFEPGLPSDPASMRFPHLYGPLPTSAVLAVVPYRPGPDGFEPPVLPPTDPAGRVATFEPSWLRRAATTEVAVPGGVAITTPAVPRSWRHNRLLLDGPVTAVDVDGAAAQQLTARGLAPAASLYGAATGVAATLAEAGWSADEIVLLGRAPGGDPVDGVSLVDLELLRPFWDAAWRRTIPDVGAEELRQLTDRELIDGAVLDVRYPAVVEDGQVVSACRLAVDGATAWIDAVLTADGHCGRGHADAVLAHALALAGRSGCDLVGLGAAADGWPRRWYERRGFAELGRFHEVSAVTVAGSASS